MGRYGCRSYKAEKYAVSVNKTFAKYIRTFYARTRVNSPRNQKPSFVDNVGNMVTNMKFVQVFCSLLTSLL